MNQVETRDNRILIHHPNKKYKFVDVLKKPVWKINKNFEHTIYVSHDGGPPKQVTDEVMFATYYFLADTMLEHKR